MLLHRAWAIVAAGVALVPLVAVMAAEPPNDDDSVTARLEVEAKADCFVIRFFVTNNGDDVDVIVGAGERGKEVATFELITGSDSIEITPPIFRRPGRRAMEPDIERFLANQEVLYDTYVLGFPPPPRPVGPRGMRARGEPTLVGSLDLWRAGLPRSRLQLRTPPVPFPPEALPK